MNNNGNNPLEQEYRSSQVYRTLTGTGNPTADKIAQGLGKAAAGIDAAINVAAQSYQAARSNPQPRPGNQYDRAASSSSGGGGTYRYRPGQGAPSTTQSTAGGPRPYAGGPRPTVGGPQPTVGGPQPTVQPPPVRPQQRVVQPPPQYVRPARPPQGVTPAPAPQMPPMKVVRRGSSAKYYITGIMAILYAMNFQMMEVREWAVFAVVVLLTFLLSGAIFKGKKEFVPMEQPKPQPEPQPEEKKEPEPVKKSATGNPEVDKIIDEGHEMIRKLRAANDAIPDEALSADIDRMERASADIFNYIAGHPGKAPQIRKFMNYYLPTTLKLLNSYEQLSKQSVKGENISSTLFNIAGMMHTVADAFEKQLDSLYADEAMDISADITVFETMLKQEGFVEDKKGKLG